MRARCVQKLLLFLVAVLTLGSLLDGVPSALGAAQPRESRKLHGWAERRLAARAAAGKAASRVVETIRYLAANVRRTRYQSRMVVRRKSGTYFWDCSAMAGWILHRSAPRAFRALNRRRPLARDFFHAIRRAPLKGSHRGWQRLGHISMARPGDLFAWLRSPLSRSRVTGHVGFFVDRPTPVTLRHSLSGRLFLARIVDATSLPHQDDTRRTDGPGGFGFGTLLFVTDRSGRAIAYGWYGTESLKWGVLPAKTIFGRVVQ